ncbi:hypothetical protein CRE_08981 [Caenorhabditis remanei]|uniref:F-box domain-containing protein n=1 Tax=Caenorhabditis remanei TaxID=31234 RepID=E3LIL7_CAERE|nr:hypothetical protein CRE_08981 [Caenorhabditis remanei]
MTEAIKRNPMILRSCILYQFSKGKPIFETFKKLCKKFGEDFMDYPEFEYWFMRFAQGNFDVDHDRNLDPKTRSFTDLPVEILKEIGGHLDLSDRFILRKVSKYIQALVDSWDPEVTALKYMDGYDSRHMYSSCWKICRKSRVYKNFEPIYSDSDENLLDLFKNPKLRLNKLSILCSDDKKKEIIKLLERSNQKIRVKLLNIDDNLLQKPTIFHMFDGKALKEVTVRIKERYSIQNLDELDVFKKLEMLTICTDFCPSDPTLLYNFPRLTITFCGNCKEEEVSRFIKNLLQSTQLQICYLSCMWNSVDFGLIKSYFVEPETMVSDLPNIRRYLIPSTNEFYQINFGEKKICIKRKQ